MQLLIFPMAALLNSFSMTALLLVFGIAGMSEVAADIGLVQGATLALFYAFSANARNLILADTSGMAALRLLQTRLLLIVPLAIAAYLLSVKIGAVAAPLAWVLIARRAAEWIGEIGLARDERTRQHAYALQTLMFECLSFLLCFVLPWAFGWSLVVSAIPWALAPLLAFRRVRKALRSSQGHFPLRSLLPHFGSTAIIGTAVYVFRISIALLAGKTIAGDLFTAFAIGGMIPTIYGQAFAPTLAHRYGTARLPIWLLGFPAAMLAICVAGSALALSEPAWLQDLNRPMIFWLAVALSIGGGSLMTVAAALRTRLIQQSEGQNVFGPDLLANVLIATCVPFAFYVLGRNSLAGLYLLSGCLSLAFVCSVQIGQWLSPRREYVLCGIGALLVIPVFFQLDGGLFADPSFVFDTQGSIFRLPVPLSAPAMFIGIVLLGNYGSASRTLAALFFSALLFVTTSLVAAQSDSSQEGAKLILLAQFLLPMFALVLGQMYGATASSQVFERTALCVLLIIMPSQMVATWLQGYSLLAPKVFFFSIHQHLQYFPMVVVALTFVAVAAFAAGGKWQRRLTLALVPLSAVYVVAAQSLLAIAALPAGLIALFVALAQGKQAKRMVVAVLLAAMAAACTYVAMSQSGKLAEWLNVGKQAPAQQALSDKLVLTTPARAPDAEAAPAPSGSLSERLAYWRFFASGIVETPWNFVFGHSAPPNRETYPSAHNYWLDVLYNFGALALLPILTLLVDTLATLWKRRTEVLSSPLMLGVAMATLYLLLGENMLKVGMRQPYPGIVTFFIWGLLIARLHSRGPTPRCP